MQEPFSKKRFIDTMRVERARWEMLLLRVGAGRMHTPICPKNRSVADIVEALYHHERWLVARLAPAQGLAVSLIDSPGDLVEASRQNFNKILRSLIPICEADLFARERLDWSHGRTLADVVSACTIDYYLAHDPPIRAWLAQPLVPAC